MTPISYVLTDTSAVSNPSAEVPQPLLGMKNPSGAGAFLTTVLAVSGAGGAQLLETTTDAIVIGGESPSTRRLLPTMTRLTAYEPTANEMLSLFVTFPGSDTQDDGVNLLATSSWPKLFDGVANYGQARANSASVLSDVTQPFAQLSAPPGEWAVNSEPAVSIQASATRAAGAAGVRHVCRSLHFSLAAVAAQTIIYARVRDGTTGAGTILWSQAIIIPAGSAQHIELSDLNIVGSAATAMTFEWSAAPVATNFQTAGGTGYSTI